MKRGKIIIILSVTFLCLSFKLERTLRLTENNILIKDTVYTDFFNPFEINKLNYSRIKSVSDSTFILLFDRPRTNIDSLFSHSEFKGEFLSATYFEIVNCTDKYVDVRYSELNEDYKYAIFTSRSLGSDLYHHYHYNFRIQNNSGQLLISSIEANNRIIDVCRFNVIR